jgi:hypothetical protein
VSAGVAETDNTRQATIGIGFGVLLGMMLNCFMAGPNVVSWDLLALGRAGPYQLVVHHAHGTIVEYFADVTAALLREGELEDLLVEAPSMSGVSPDPRWTPVDLEVH